MHFIAIRDPQAFWNAVRVFGHFEHRVWDRRAAVEIMDGDIAVFGKADPEASPSPYGFDDSNEPDDPATKERLR
jgi:hypothetical protein